MYYFTDTATTTDSRDVYFPLNLVCERAREGQGRQWRGVVSLPPSLSCGRNQHPETYRWVTMATLQEGRQELGGAVSCGAGVRLVSKASYGTSALKHYGDYSRRHGPSPSPGPSPVLSPLPTNAFIQDRFPHYSFTLRLGLWLRLYAPHNTPHIPADLLSPLLNPLSTPSPVRL